MSVLQIIYAPNKIFKQKAQEIEEVNGEIKSLADDMLDTMEFEKAVGIGANMLGINRAIAVVDLQEDGKSNPYVLINPKIVKKSSEMQVHEEASLSFPGIFAEIKRPKKITLEYLDKNGVKNTLEAEDFLAQVIQHEVDYLNGITFLDHLSKMKRDMLLKKMQKYIEKHPPHVHGAHCNH